MVTTKHTDLVAQLATLLHQVGPLAALVNSDDFSDEDRGRLRELVKSERLFDLSQPPERLMFAAGSGSVNNLWAHSSARTVIGRN